MADKPLSSASGIRRLNRQPTNTLTRSAEIGINRLEESVSLDVYSSQNDEIGIETRREISKIAGCIRALVEAGKRVDEEMVVKTYEACLELEDEGMDDGLAEGERPLASGARMSVGFEIRFRVRNCLQNFLCEFQFVTQAAEHQRSQAQGKFRRHSLRLALWLGHLLELLREDAPF